MSRVANKTASSGKTAKRERKSTGATYTPPQLAKFVAQQMLNEYVASEEKRDLRILDPAVGDGELLVSLVTELKERHPSVRVVCDGFDTNGNELEIARTRLESIAPDAVGEFRNSDFLEEIMSSGGINVDLFSASTSHKKYDLIIANPPYVRTQVLGAERARQIAKEFSLRGRIDLYYAFLLGMSVSLNEQGIAGVIVSNRFMTTKSGASVRRELLHRFDVFHIWDFGDTKLFDAAVLPAVLMLGPKASGAGGEPKLTSIYQSEGKPSHSVSSPFDALNYSGRVQVEDARIFEVKHGSLSSRGGSEVWSLISKEAQDFLSTVDATTWATFAEIGKIRVGVKTCADKVFIRKDWSDTFSGNTPELLRALTTHHIARRFRADRQNSNYQILYPHEVVGGRRRAVDLEKYPVSKKYLESCRAILESRSYVTKAGRKWYEIWVPQDPDAWSCPKLVFRDISEHPTFWIDLSGSVVNGDCYWMKAQSKKDEDLLWLALCVANSSFIETFYDVKFNNRLYAGRRRFITQYVEKFPLPEPSTEGSQKMVEMAKAIYSKKNYEETTGMQSELDSLVWRAFGLRKKVLG